MMKKKDLIGILLLVSLFSLTAAAQDYYNVSHSCPYRCINGRLGLWQVRITHWGESERGILQVRIRDSVGLDTIAFTRKSNDTEELVAYPPYSWDNESLGDIVKLDYGESYTFNLSANFPKANIGKNLTYQVCVMRSVQKHTWHAVGEAIEHCFSENHTIVMTDCVWDPDCDYDEYCINESCKPLNCTEKQYAKDHMCFEHDCLGNEDCEMDEQCIENTCNGVVCEDIMINETEEGANSSNITIIKQYVVNHSCTAEPCSIGEIIINSSCVRKECGFDEYVADYSCKKLDCAFDEGFFDHRCKKLSCQEGEGIENHSCVKLECEDNEAIMNYTCTRLRCGILRKAESHSCLINSEMFLAIFFLVVLVVLDYLLFRTYKWKHRKRMVSSLLLKAKDKMSQDKKS